MKRCSKCGEEKEESEFYSNKSKSSGLDPYCKECRRVVSKTWNKKHRVWTKLNEEQKQRRNNYGRWYRQKRRYTVLEHYGSKCAMCGYNNMIALTLDHIENDGAEHRKEMVREGTQIYLWARKHSYPPTLQVLCRNCNWIKYHNTLDK